MRQFCIAKVKHHPFRVRNPLNVTKVGVAEPRAKLVWQSRGQSWCGKTQSYWGSRPTICIGNSIRVTYAQSGADLTHLFITMFSHLKKVKTFNKEEMLVKLVSALVGTMNSTSDRHFGCSFDVMSLGCCGFFCCVFWMLRFWMLQYGAMPLTNILSQNWRSKDKIRLHLE